MTTPSRKNMLLLLVALAVCLAVLMKGMLGFLPIPLSARHLWHLAIAPTDLYRPIVFDDFDFCREGFSKEYPLVPCYLDIYELGISFGDNPIPSNLAFDGKLKVEFSQGSKKIGEMLITSSKGGAYASSDLKNYKAITLMEFELPVQGKYLKNLSAKMTVLKPANSFASFRDTMKCYIAVSSRP